MGNIIKKDYTDLKVMVIDESSEFLGFTGHVVVDKSLHGNLVIVNSKGTLFNINKQHLKILKEE